MFGYMIDVVEGFYMANWIEKICEESKVERARKQVLSFMLLGSEILLN